MAANGNGNHVALSANHELMSRGSVMQSYSGSAESPESRSIFLWWEAGAAAGKHGTIYFNDDVEKQEKNKVDGQSLPLNKVTDVFSGKQQAVLKSTSLSAVPSEVCFGLGSKSLPLALQAESAAVRTAWIAGIKEVFAKSAKKDKAATNGAAAATAASTTAAAEEAAPVETNAAAPAAETTPAEPVAAQTTATPVPVVAATVPAAAAAASPTPVAAADPIAAMVAGQRFVSLTGTEPTVATDIFIFYDRDASKFGMLYQTPAVAEGEQPRNRDESTQIQVHRVTDVFRGRRAAEFSGTGAPSAPSTQCFSIVSKDRSLHLIAPSDDVRATWLAGVQAIFDQHQAAAAARAAAKAAAAAEAAQSTNASSPPDVLSTGRVYQRLTLVDGVVSSSSIFMWHDPSEGRLGTLYYSSSPEDKTKASERAMPVAKIKDVFLGKQSAELKSDAASAIPSNQCFSLVINDRESLHLVAADDQTRNATLANIQGFWPKQKASAATPAPVPAESPVTVTVTEGSSTPVPDSLQPLRDGAIFQSYTIVPETADQPSPDEVFVFLSTDAPEDGATGSFYYNPTGASNPKEKNADRQLALHTVGNVYVGLHAWKIVKAGLPQAPASRALSLAGKQRSLNLVAQDDATRATWANGVKSLFEAALAKQKAAAATVPASAGVAPTSTLIQGGEFTAHSATGPNGALVSKPVFVFLDPSVERLGTLYWCNVGRREVVAGQSIPVHKVSDVFLGKHASYRNAPGAANVRASSCFTLASRAISINLEAKSTEHRDATIADLRVVLTSGGKKVDERGSKKPAASGNHFLFLPDVPNSPRGDGDNVATQIADGEDFDSWVLQQNGARCVSSPVHVWYEKEGSARFGSLYWCPRVVGQPTQRAKVAGQILPLGEITDVFAGKHAEEFRHLDAAEVPIDRCISLRSQTHPNHNLNIVAASAQAQRRWVRGLRKAFGESTRVETRPVRAGYVPPEAVSSPKSSRANQSRLAALIAGHPITAVSQQGETETVTLWLDQSEGRSGTLYWGPTRAKDASRALPVHTIGDVYVGRKTAPLRLPSMSGVPANQCFGVSSKSRKLDAYAQSQAARQQILDGLAAAIQANGTPVREYEHGAPKSNLLVSDAVLRADIAFIEAGQVILLHHTAGAAPRPVFLWYEPQHGKQGAVFWTDVKIGVQPTRNKQKGQSFLLQHVSDVMVARQSDIFKAAAPSLKPELCFSLLTNNGNGPRVDAQVNTRAERDEWLRALRVVFSVAQKRIVEGSGVPHSRKLKVGTVVDTFYGRGEVAQPTRKDGITAVNVDGTVCFLNTASIRPVPMLYTPFGTGVPPIVIEQRQDGIRAVQLKWATAYLNKSSISLQDPSLLASPTPLIARPTSPSREQSIAVLQRGATFTLVAEQLSPVFFYFGNSGSDLDLGSLLFNAGTERTEHPTGLIPLKSLSDLLVGKQSSSLRALGEAVPNSRVFSLLVRDGRSYDLIAETDEQRSDFLYALFDVLSNSGRKISQSRRGQELPGTSPPAAGNNEQRRYSFSMQQVPPVEKARAFLDNGAPFHITIARPDGTQISEDAFVFLKGHQLVWSSSYWTSSSPAQKDPIRIIDLTAVRDVWYGKKVDIFRQPSFAPIASERCFSIGVKDAVTPPWNLVASSREVRDRFFYSLQSVLTSPPIAPNVVSRGAIFTRFVPGPDGDVVSEKIFLFHELDETQHGSLYWNTNEGDRTLSAERQLPLNIIRDVFVGRNTKVTKHPNVASVPKEELISLLARPSKVQPGQTAALEVQASSPDFRNKWIDALKAFWKNSTSQRVKPTAVASPTAVNLSPEAIASIAATTQRSFQIPPVFAVGALQAGVQFHARDVFYVADQSVDAPFGSIFVAATGSRAQTEENQYALHRIERVVIASASSIQIDTATQSVVLQSLSVENVAIFLSAIQYLLAATGFRVTVDPTGQVYTVNDISAISRPTAVPSLPSAAVLPSFTAGTEFTSADRAAVRVFAEGATLYYAPAADKDRATPLSQLTRLTTGANGPASVTLQTKETELALEAKSSAALALFLSGLTAFVAANGATIASETKNQSESQRSYTVAGAPAASVVDGGVFTAYTQRKGQLVHQSLAVWIDTDANGVAALFFGDAADPLVIARAADAETDSQVEVADISSVTAGQKSTPVLQNVDVAAELCVSIVAPGVKLDLVAQDAAQAQAIVAAIQAKKGAQ